MVGAHLTFHRNEIWQALRVVAAVMVAADQQITVSSPNTTIKLHLIVTASFVTQIEVENDQLWSHSFISHRILYDKKYLQWTFFMF